MKRPARGYTIVEVMIALTLITLGVSGVVAMQKVTTVANRDARNLAVANQIARTWLDRLRTDAVAWNLPSPTSPTGNDIASDTRWLKQIEDSPMAWFQPETIPDWGGPAFDMNGTDVSESDDAAPMYCTNVRLQWIYGPPAVAPPPYLIRAEVRVFWLREGAGLPDGMDSFCDPSSNENEDDVIGTATDRFHFVYATSAIKQNPH